MPSLGMMKFTVISENISNRFIGVTSDLPSFHRVIPHSVTEDKEAMVKGLTKGIVSSYRATGSSREKGKEWFLLKIRKRRSVEAAWYHEAWYHDWLVRAKGPIKGFGLPT